MVALLIIVMFVLLDGFTFHVKPMYKSSVDILIESATNASGTDSQTQTARQVAF